MLKRCPCTALALIFMCAFTWSITAQRRTPTPAIIVTGDVKQPLTLTAADLAKMPRAAVTTRNNTAAWQGVWLSEILKRAGVPLGTELRATALTPYVLVSASDGYQVLFSLGELDADMTDSQVLVADTANGKSLIDEGESFRLVLPKDKQGARSIRMLTRIEVVRLRK